jgi:RNA polymerase sigma-70 factor (ECF subfamily)
MNGYPLKISGLSGSQKMQISAKETEPDDNTLVDQALRGKIDSFKCLVEKYKKPAFFFARAMVGNSEDAYDLSQEAFIRVHRHLKRFDPTYTFKSWFFHILSNLCKNHLRQRKNRGVQTGSAELIENMAAPATGRPDMAYQRAEIEQKIREAIDELPEKFREIIVLSHFDEMSYEQIAGVLDIPRGSVMSRLYYARRKLREILNRRGADL